MQRQEELCVSQLARASSVASASQLMSRKRKPPGAAPAPGEGLSTTALVVGVLLLAAAIAAYAILGQFKSAAPAKPEAAKAFVPLAGLAADAQSAEAGFLRWLSRNGARVASVRLAQIPGTVSYTHLTLPTICSV